MTTALDLIKRSLRMLGVYSLGEEPSADESQTALDVLNALVEEFSNGGLVYAKTLDTIALSASQSSVTVGPSGTTITTRPVRVLPQSYITLSGVSYPLELLNLEQYNAIGVKAISGIPAGIWVQPDMPNVTITFWPVPSEAMTFNLWSDKVFASFADLTTTVSLPPGYENALPSLLAVELAPEYEAEPSKEVKEAASRGRRVLKRANVQVPQQRLDVPGTGGVITWQAGA